MDYSKFNRLERQYQDSLDVFNNDDDRVTDNINIEVTGYDDQIDEFLEKITEYAKNLAEELNLEHNL